MNPLILIEKVKYVPFPNSHTPYWRKTIRKRETSLLHMGYILSGNRKEAAVLGKLQSFNLSRT